MRYFHHLEPKTRLPLDVLAEASSILNLMSVIRPGLYTICSISYAACYNDMLQYA